MWLERLNIVVPSLVNPRLPYATGFYVPTLTEWSLFVGMLALFALCFIFFSKLFPVVSIWEIQEGRTHAVREVDGTTRALLSTSGLASAYEGGFKMRKWNMLFVFQLCSLLGVWVFSLGISIFIIQLIRLANQLNDAATGSVVLSIVLIPIFLFIASVLTYVFIGLQMGKED